MQVTSSQKERSGKPLTESAALGRFRDWFHPFLMKLAAPSVTYPFSAENDYSPLPDRPIIFAGNHYCGLDVIVAANLVHGRAQIVAGKQPLTPVDEFFFNMNGTVFVDRKNKEDTAACKRAMEALLKQGKNVIIFPEGTSNVSDELLMYPMKWGVIEVAQKTGAQIIPMVLDYDHDLKQCRVRFGTPLLMDGLSKAEGIALLRDTMASERWNFFSRRTASRAGMDLAEERRKNKQLLLAYKLLDYDYERTVVFHPYPTEEEVFEPICRAYANKI